MASHSGITNSLENANIIQGEKKISSGDQTVLKLMGLIPLGPNIAPRLSASAKPLLLDEGMRLKSTSESLSMVSWGGSADESIPVQTVAPSPGPAVVPTTNQTSPVPASLPPANFIININNNPATTTAVTTEPPPANPPATPPGTVVATLPAAPAAPAAPTTTPVVDEAAPPTHQPTVSSPSAPQSPAIAPPVVPSDPPVAPSAPPVAIPALPAASPVPPVAPPAVVGNPPAELSLPTVPPAPMLPATPTTPTVPMSPETLGASVAPISHIPEAACVANKTDTDLILCAGHGECLRRGRDLEEATYSCTCAEGWSGNVCTIMTDCLNKCSGHGTCGPEVSRHNSRGKNMRLKNEAESTGSVIFSAISLLEAESKTFQDSPLKHVCICLDGWGGVDCTTVVSKAVKFCLKIYLDDGLGDVSNKIVTAARETDLIGQITNDRFTNMLRETVGDFAGVPPKQVELLSANTITSEGESKHLPSSMLLEQKAHKTRKNVVQSEATSAEGQVSVRIQVSAIGDEQQKLVGEYLAPARINIFNSVFLRLMKNHGFDKGDFGVDGFSIKAEDVTRPEVTITTPAAGGGDVGTLVPVGTVAVPAPILENSATAIAPVTAGTPVTAPVSSESNVSTPAAMVASVAPATPAALTSVPPVTAAITLNANVSTPVALAATATTATPAAIPVAAAAAPAAPVSVTQSLQSSMASAGLRGTENFDLSVQVLSFYFVVSNMFLRSLSY